MTEKRAGRSPVGARDFSPFQNIQTGYGVYPSSNSGGAVGWGTALQPGRSRVRFLTVSLEFSRQLYYPGVDWASSRNGYQEHFLGGKGGRCVGLTTLPPSCADCLEIWAPKPPGTLWACNSPAQKLLLLTCSFFYLEVKGPKRDAHTSCPRSCVIMLLPTLMPSRRGDDLSTRTTLTLS